jgi:hypothetical protein
VNQRETVELIMALTSLDSKVASALVSTQWRLYPHPLHAAPTQQADTIRQLCMLLRFSRVFFGLVCACIFRRTALMADVVE